MADITEQALADRVAARITARMIERGLSDERAAALCWPDDYDGAPKKRVACGKQMMRKLRLGIQFPSSSRHWVGLERGLGLAPHELLAP